MFQVPASSACQSDLAGFVLSKPPKAVSNDFNLFVSVLEDHKESVDKDVKQRFSDFIFSVRLAHALKMVVWIKYENKIHYFE